MSIEERMSKALDLVCRMAKELEPDHEDDVIIPRESSLWEEIKALAKDKS